MKSIATRAVVAVAAAIVCLSPAVKGAQPVDRIWFCPGPGTIDFVRLFQHPEEWPRARTLMDVFKVYQGHTQTPPPQLFLPNSYDAFAAAGVFRTLTQWNKKIAIEAGAVKEFYCTPDASGMQAAINGTLDSIRAVQSAGGTVSYIAMDEPFVSGRSKTCGGPALEPTADRVAQYMNAVTAAYPGVRVGLIEAYPFLSAASIESAVQLLKARGVPPVFLHMDVDWHLAGPAAFKRDMAALQSFAAAQGVPFGIIITGYSGEADALYAVDVGGIVNLISETFGTWDHMPDQLIFQSWAQTSTGYWLTPNNLPEDRAYTHTHMLWDELRRLTGSTGSPTGTAIIRR
jgi:hypothetical protein